MGELKKAILQQIDEKFENQINDEKEITVQFNPETLKVTYANQIATPSGAGDQSGSPSQLFVGAGTTKLAVQIWFDVTAENAAGAGDVRELTGKVAYFITPEKKGTKFVPPAVRFLWGSFKFDGIMESLDESLEFFSEDGKPLRASMSFTLSQQKILFIAPPKAPPFASPPAGTRPHTQAPAGSTAAGLAAGQGKGGDWKGIAAANGIENPRFLAPGQLIDMNLSAGANPGASAQIQTGVTGGGGGIQTGTGRRIGG